MSTPAMRPHLVLYTEAPEPGGVTGVLEPVVRKLASRYQITLVIARTPALMAWASALSSSCRVRIAPLALANRADLGGWLDFPRMLKLFRLLRRAQLLHVHQHTVFSCLAALALAGVSGIPSTISTEHYLPQLRFLRRRSLSGPLALVRELRIRLQLRLKRRSLRALDRIVLVSQANRDLLGSLFPHETRGKMLVIPNGVELSRYQCDPEPGRKALQQLAGSQAVQFVLVVAGLNNQKGHAVLFQAIPAVLKQSPGARFVLVGEGHLRPGLEALADDLGIRQSVFFAGRRRDVPELLAACDLVVLPSLFEGMPLSVLEAMAAGKAVVATGVDGTREAVEQAGSGLLVPPSDPGALADAIITLLADPDRRRAYGQRGRELAAARFDSSLMTAGYAALYDQLAGGA